MDPKIIAALIGLSSAVITSFIVSWLSYKKLKKDLVLEYKTELIKKQMESCENLWESLTAVSFTLGNECLVKNIDDKPTVDIEEAKSFVKASSDVFLSSFGLYFSRNIRDSLFDLRDFIVDEFIKKSEAENYVISKRLLKRFRGKVGKLRTAIREEIGVRDLKVTENRLNSNE